jgi:hypothetical protein
MKLREYIENVNEANQDMTQLQPYFQAVAGYLGQQPKIATFFKYSEEEWGMTFGNDHEMLLGRTAAMFDQDRNLHVRQSASGNFDPQGVLLHEVVHATGFDKMGVVCKDVNEAMTQLVAEEIGRLNRIKVRPTYHEQVVTLKKMVIPLVGMDLQKLAKLYARVNDPALLLAGSIWSKYWHYFTDTANWGDLKDCQKSILQMFKHDPFNGWPYLEHILDELKTH